MRSACVILRAYFKKQPLFQSSNDHFAFIRHSIIGRSKREQRYCNVKERQHGIAILIKKFGCSINKQPVSILHVGFAINLVLLIVINFISLIVSHDKSGRISFLVEMIVKTHSLNRISTMPFHYSTKHHHDYVIFTLLAIVSNPYSNH